MRLAIVLGGADDLREDFERLRRMIPPDLTDVVSVGVNDVPCYWRHRIDFWVTLHPEKLVDEDPDDPDGLSWQERRRKAGGLGGYETIARRMGRRVHHLVQPWGGGSVSMYATRACEHPVIGADLVALCGCGLSESPNDPASLSAHTVIENLEDFRRGWERRLSREGSPPTRYIRERVRSLSGWTAEILGEPDDAWFRTPPRD